MMDKWLVKLPQRSEGLSYRAARIYEDIAAYQEAVQEHRHALRHALLVLSNELNDVEAAGKAFDGISRPE